MSETMVVVQEPQLKQLVVDRLTAVGMRSAEARTVADVLVYADLHGIHSHGVLRVEHYVNRICSGGMNLTATLELERLRPSIGLVDAQGCVGHVATRHATEAAIKIAAAEGMALVGIRNNSHCGALGYYVDMALDAGVACLMCANTDKAVVPFGGRVPFFGTNPLAFGLPGQTDSILLDMATSEVSLGKVLYAKELGQEIPATWTVDESGQATTDPNQAAALVPFGAGYKGYGINLMVEALTGVMIGGIFGPHLTKMYGDLDSYRDLANFILVVDPTVFDAEAAFRERTQQMIDQLRALPAAADTEGVRVPGEAARRIATRQRREGIPLPQAIYDYLAGGAGE